MATYTKPRTPGAPRQAPPPERGTPPGRGTPPRRGRPGPADVTHWTRPLTAPRHTWPLVGTGPRPAAEPAARPAQPTTSPAAHPPTAGTRARRPRAPFILLLVGLLGGALVSLLVISTTLAQGSYRITNLQQQNANLAKQEQLLTQQVAQASSPTQIAQEAEQFGMRPNPHLQFINLKTGKVIKGQVSKADAEINVPGYTP